ncbi:hypothetical protein BL250_11025 [Erwinia sp. OLTSP20]|uniref:MurR/RpiR family transcriptional regulator n=1 Tax=unclassified Erwinia TaxID=2622719 RepID=UPI000C177408|nr:MULTISPECIES: MurR/RpiR family transcriptional regulator [unclassified Erwinia]PIJ50297.1 hypothetical protein BV501_09535 [Erwinia sp. OAMSP11]PIJ72135.1 hypothetical protein BK416_10430 [Erwinia sp. OLSSP12]PIJ81426.1 hypothetical protein BLD47_09255 [Erwinia sp. OLCASP19]PIJ84132.1 hypothetical protein BLD46_08835 [Erwinia sp. OLMTSP26]PIJ85831.1 hypothetical protein BLD49_10055 [Erwinia sp. OLMDSP33]
MSQEKEYQTLSSPSVTAAPSFAARVAAVNLFPAEQRIVTQLLGIPHYEIGIITSSDLSQRSGASRSSIDRLSRKLGYPGLKEMRKALLAENVPDDPLATASQGDDNDLDGQIASRVMSAVALRAQAMARILSASTTLTDLIPALATARNILLLGAGESAAVCQVLYMRLVRLGLPVRFCEEYHTQVTLASLLNEQDLALVVSHSGSTPPTLWAARCASQHGARLALVTGTASSALSRLADLTVLLPTSPGLPGSAEVLDRVIGCAFAEVLFQCLAARHPEWLNLSVRIDDVFAEKRR